MPKRGFRVGVERLLARGVVLREAIARILDGEEAEPGATKRPRQWYEVRELLAVAVEMHDRPPAVGSRNVERVYRAAARALEPADTRAVHAGLCTGLGCREQYLPLAQEDDEGDHGVGRNERSQDPQHAPHPYHAGSW